MNKISIFLSLILLLSIFAVLPISAAPTEVWVDDDFDSGTSGWGITHFNKIQDGINAVDPGGTVYVAAGTYTLTAEITITEDISLLGEDKSTTIIDGNNSVRIMRTWNLSQAAIIDGFTFLNGYASDGGGMYNASDSSPTISNCIFSNNSAKKSGGTYFGGGMFNQSNSSPTVTNCIFSGNTADNGGGMFNQSNSSPTVTNCIFSGNTADYYGGGMNNNYSSPTVTNCTFAGNTADSHGGGIANGFSSPTVTNCILWGNPTWEIYDFDSSPVVTYCDVQGGCTGTGNIDSDPLFVDAPSGDFRLNNYSPCINAGTDAGVYDDILGTVRPQVMGFDMGAYEYELLLVILTVDDIDHCAGTIDVTAITSGGTPPYVYYDWDFNGDCIFEAQTSSNTYTMPVGHNFMGQVVVRVTDSIGVMDMDNEYVSTNAELTVSVTEYFFPCEGVICYSAQGWGGDHNYAYSWTVTGDGTPDGINSSGLIIFGYGVSGTVSLTVTDGEGCIANYGPVNYNANPQLLVALFIDYDPGKANLTALAIGGDGSYTYDWDLAGDGNYELIGTTSNTQTIVGPGSSGTAFVQVRDGEGCEANDWADYEIEKFWSPIMMQPLVSNMLSMANTIWACLLQELPEEVPEDVLALLDEIQAHVENASALANPVYANGELNMAMHLMEQISKALDCECYPE